MGSRRNCKKQNPDSTEAHGTISGLAPGPQDNDSAARIVAAENVLRVRGRAIDLDAPQARDADRVEIERLSPRPLLVPLVRLADRWRREGRRIRIRDLRAARDDV